MKVTGTMKTEKMLVELYKKSKNKFDDKEADKAKQTICLIECGFDLISIFTEVEHVKIVSKLYFTTNNMFIIGLKPIADKVYVKERTLFDYRQKYCKVINFILEFIKKNNLFD